MSTIPESNPTLGPLAFTAEDVAKCFTPPLGEDDCETMAKYLNRILAEKLAKAPVVNGIPKGLPVEGIDNLWAQDDYHHLNTHTARLVCVKELIANKTPPEK